jgi:hypothetical protein
MSGILKGGRNRPNKLVLDGVEPMDLRGEVSRVWLNRHFNIGLDEMGAAAVWKMGWTKQDILKLEACVGKWNKLLKTDFKLMPFSGKTNAAGSGRPIDRTCSEDGVLYLDRFGPNYMECLDVFVAHEIGHYIELKRGDFRDSGDLRAFMNTHRNAGLMDEIYYKDSTSIPPFNIPLWHEKDVEAPVETTNRQPRTGANRILRLYLSPDGYALRDRLLIKVLGCTRTNK